LAEESGVCKYCELGFYWNSENSQCDTVSLNLQIDHCRSYNENQDCVLCISEYRLINNQCLYDYQQISDCSEFNSENSKCQKCLPGFRLSSDGKHCDDMSSQNCLIPSYFSCEECSQNFYPNQIKFTPSSSSENMLLNSSILLSSISSETNKTIFQSFVSNLYSKNEFICEKTQLDNCKILKSFSECQECFESFVLNAASGKCEPEILPEIPFCITYFGRGACSICEENYFKKSNMECIPIFKINFCLEYAQAYDGCLKCENEYKLSSSGASNSCQTRSNYPIQNCGISNSFLN
jgi:hypothetical protein